MTRQRLGDERLDWLTNLLLVVQHESFALVHASAQSCWHDPAESANDAEVELAYGFLGKSVIVFGHVHRSSIRSIAGQMRKLVNAGSAGLSYDGDSRASYLLLDEGVLTIRRVAYDLDRELAALAACGLPRAEWTSRMPRTSAL